MQMNWSNFINFEVVWDGHTKVNKLMAHIAKKSTIRQQQDKHIKNTVHISFGGKYICYVHVL